MTLASLNSHCDQRARAPPKSDASFLHLLNSHVQPCLSPSSCASSCRRRHKERYRRHPCKRDGKEGGRMVPCCARNLDPTPPSQHLPPRLFVAASCLPQLRRAVAAEALGCCQWFFEDDLHLHSRSSRTFVVVQSSTFSHIHAIEHTRALLNRDEAAHSVETILPRRSANG